MNYVIQLLLSILRTISHNVQFNSSTEGSISKSLFETAHNAFSSTDVDALKFRPAFDAKRTLDLSNLIVFYNLQNI